MLYDFDNPYEEENQLLLYEEEKSESDDGSFLSEAESLEFRFQSHIMLDKEEDIRVPDDHHAFGFDGCKNTNKLFYSNDLYSTRELVLKEDTATFLCTITGGVFVTDNRHISERDKNPWEIEGSGYRRYRLVSKVEYGNESFVFNGRKFRGIDVLWRAYFGEVPKGYKVVFDEKKLEYEQRQNIRVPTPLNYLVLEKSEENYCW